MANQAAKKGAQRASRAYAIWTSVVIAVYAIYIPLQFFLDDPTAWSWYQLFLQLLVGGGYYLGVTGIASAAEQGDEGALYHDLVYLLIMAQLGSIYSELAWWILVVIPLYGIYKGYNLYASFKGQVAPEQEDPADAAKNEEKRKARQRRRQQKRGP